MPFDPTAANPGDSVEVDTSDTPVVGLDMSKGQLYLTSDPDNDATIYLCLAEEGAEVGKGIPLAPGGSFNESYAGPVCAIAASGTQTLCIVEV